MNDTNKTAVEFLIEELNNIKSSSTDQYGKITFLEKEFIRVLNQVIEMEKQQIIQSNRDGVDMIINEKHFISGEKYYNETFKKK
jgi:hypothetical protein